MDIESDADTPESGWRNTTPAKPLDIDGDNILGTDGWFLDHTKSVPSYVSIIKPGANVNGMSAWGLLDNPSDPSGKDDVIVSAFHDTRAGLGDTTAPLIKWVIKGNHLNGKTLRLGVLSDVMDTGTATYTLEQTVGGSANATSPALAYNGDSLDVAFFDVTGALEGDTFVITSTTLTGGKKAGFEQVVGITFDTGAVISHGYGGGSTLTSGELTEIAGVTVDASTYNKSGAGFQPTRSIDGSGMKNGEHDDGPGTAWMLPTLDPSNEWIQWDLGASYTLGSIHVWNLNNIGNEGFSTKSVDIYFSDAANPGDPEGEGAANWTKLGGKSVVLPQAPVSGEANTGFDLAAATSMTLPNTPVRYVRFEVNSNWLEEKNYTGIAEIQFFARSGKVNPTSANLTGNTPIPNSSKQHYFDWINGFSGLNGLKAFNDDADGDGIKNGVENYFGTHPGELSQGLALVNFTGDTFVFTHPLNNAPVSDVSAEYRWSKDGKNFYADGESHQGTAVSFSQGVPSGGVVTVTGTITGSELEELLVDVKVTQN